MSEPDLLNWLFLDLNSYFASVEQQEVPSLRGRPVAVLPVMTDTTCCIAASYEAKAFGIRTGTLVREARALCPSLKLVEARQDVYVAYHRKIVDVVESCIPVEAVLSIDEMICRLSGSQRQPENAVALSLKIKRALAEKAGAHVRCSIGLAPNRFLAKVAGDMQKPDGLTVLLKKEVPQRLYGMSVRDLPGVGGQMEARLRTAGIRTVQQLSQLSEEDMRRLWGGIVGDRLWSWLRGKDTVLPTTRRHSIGHSHVLPPEERNRAGLHHVVKKLASKAAVRLRRERLWTTGLSLGVRFRSKDSWEGRARFGEAQDTPRLLKVLEELWEGVPQKDPMWAAVTLFPLIPEDHHTPSLFENPKREILSSVMDTINDKYGKNTAYFASLHDSLTQAPTRIAFSRIPDLAEF
jgi:DNA polymerase IV